jgi:hypothetical protein
LGPVHKARLKITPDPQKPDNHCILASYRGHFAKRQVADRNTITTLLPSGPPKKLAAALARWDAHFGPESAQPLSEPQPCLVASPGEPPCRV